MSAGEIEANKRAVQKLFAILYGDGTNVDDLDAIVAGNYVQHNPNAGQGRNGVKQLFREILPLPAAFSASTLTEERYIAEGEFVVRQELRPQGMIVDIFRVHDGVLCEHWDAFRGNPGQEPPPGL